MSALPLQPIEPTRAQMSLRVVADGMVVAAFSGRIDAKSVREHRDLLHSTLETGATRLVVDLGEVSFLDSAGMAMLVSLLKRARQAGGDVRVAQPADPAVRRILELTRLDLVFNLTDSVDEAVRGLQRS